MYRSNLTEEETDELMVELSQKRAFRLSSQFNYAFKNREATHSNKSTYPDVLTPFLGPAFDSVFIVEVRIGTPPQKFYLEFDTGSDLIWVQCAGCIDCFDVHLGNFEYSKSSTYQLVSCGHPSCDPDDCKEGICTAKVSYADGGYTQGPLSKDDFQFFSLDKGVQTVNGVFFGCSLRSSIAWGENIGRIAGIFGMGTDPNSFISQLGTQGQRRRFSYCLRKADNRPGRSYNYLRFGEDAVFPAGSDVRTTPMVEGPFGVYYYVNLNDISVNSIRLGLPPDTFRIRDDETGGIVLDTGTSTTYIFSDAYNRLVARLKEVLAPYNLRPYLRNNKPMKRLCYVRPPGFNNFPSITFHFDGADFEPYHETTYSITNDRFCLQIRPTDVIQNLDVSIFGSFFLAEQYFVHDNEQRTISFARADCSK
ncbi:hypothetical protein IFM89_029960 [Coptis chinensis]|uniref:Peptidase A1 domain-containing protein n=1 Tax=Coptis chinensis TaxID=261450 RepID=A0A835HGE5_9MAGN|nr:hypothetical protein IFM89_029960 [Coptis chinensis]